jgi:hypothetical protein
VTRTLAQIKAEQAALASEAAALEKPVLEEAQAYLKSTEFKAVLDMVSCATSAAISLPIDLQNVTARLQTTQQGGPEE